MSAPTEADYNIALLWLRDRLGAEPPADPLSRADLVAQVAKELLAGGSHEADMTCRFVAVEYTALWAAEDEDGAPRIPDQPDNERAIAVVEAMTPAEFAAAVRNGMRLQALKDWPEEPDPA